MDDRFADHNNPTPWGNPGDRWADRGEGGTEQEPRRPFSVAGPFGIRVLSQQCATCVFRPGNPMHLAPGRLKGLVHGALDDDTAIICHATLDRAEQAVCRGFADTYDTTPLQVARRLSKLIEVDPPPASPGSPR